MTPADPSAFRHPSAELSVSSRPTAAISCDGCFPLGVTLDHMGPLARTVDDIVLLLEAHAGRAPETHRAEPTCASGCRKTSISMASSPKFVDAVHSAARQAETFGAKIVPIRVPAARARRRHRTYHPSARSRNHLLRCTGREDISPETLALLESGLKSHHIRLHKNHWNANRLRALWAKLFDDIDVLFTPTTPTVAPKIGETTIRIRRQDHDTRLLTTRFCRGINLLGYPAISIPCGTTGEGLPVGLQIVGALNRDTTVLDLAAALE